MEPFDSEELADRELNALLREWQAPPAPPTLRAAVFPDPPRANPPKPWWQALWTASIRVPLPVALCLATLFAVSAWRWTRPAAVRPSVVMHERVEGPADAANRLTQMAAPAACFDSPSQGSRGKRALTFHELQPVGELRPRIIRSEHVEN